MKGFITINRLRFLFPFFSSMYHKQNILDVNYVIPKKARALKMADMSDELHILTREI